MEMKIDEANKGSGGKTERIEKIQLINANSVEYNTVHPEVLVDNNKLKKKLSVCVALIFSFISGLIKSTYCWHPNCVKLEEKTSAVQFQIIDLPVIIGALLSTCLSCFYSGSINKVLLYSSILTCISSLSLKFIRLNLKMIYTIRFLLGLGMGLFDTFIPQYYSTVTQIKGKKVMNLTSGIKMMGMSVGLGLFLFFDREFYEIIFGFALAQMLLTGLVIQNISITDKKSTNETEFKAKNLLILFGLFFILQGMFGQNLLLCHDSVITPTDYIIFNLVYTTLLGSVKHLKYFYFNYNLKLKTVYFIGGMACVISQSCIAMEKHIKISLFTLYVVYNLFSETLPEIGLGVIFKHETDKLLLMIKTITELLTDTVGRTLLLFIDETDIKHIIPVVIIVVVIINGVLYVVYKNR